MGWMSRADVRFRVDFQIDCMSPHFLDKEYTGCLLFHVIDTDRF